MTTPAPKSEAGRVMVMVDGSVPHFELPSCAENKCTEVTDPVKAQAFHDAQKGGGEDTRIPWSGGLVEPPKQYDTLEEALGDIREDREDA